MKNISITDVPIIGSERNSWVEPWYLSYAILGCTMGGMFPILIPLLALRRFADIGHVGMVMAASTLAGLAAPIWGSIVDRYRIHRGLLVSGLIVTATALAALSFAKTLTAWLGLALMQGFGVSVAFTVCNLFIVECYPKAEWDERIGWLQTFNSSGQVSGMLLAAVLSRMDLSSSLLVAAGLTAAAVLPCRYAPITPCKPLDIRPATPYPDHHRHWIHFSPRLQLNEAKVILLRNLKLGIKTPFEYFMMVWFLCVTSTSAVFTLYPVMMQEGYGVGQRLLSLVFAMAMGLSVFLYPHAGRWGHTFGSDFMLRNSIGVRLFIFIGFYMLELSCIGCQVQLVVLTFSAFVLCWPFLIVNGTALTAQISPFGEGEGMGIFHAVLAIACVSGSALGGWLAARWGYYAVFGLAIGTESLGLILMNKTRHTLSQF